MIDYILDPANGILHIQPKAALERTDFEQLARAVDPFISRTGQLAGLIIETPGFPGWSSFEAMIAHLRFVKGHHRHIKKIAVVTSSALGNVAEHLVAHFVSAEIRQFSPSELEAARQWILGRA